MREGQFRPTGLSTDVPFVRAILAVVMLGSISLVFPPGAGAFTLPERFEFDLRWIGIYAGTSVMEIKNHEAGKLLFSSTVKSADWVSVFYPVEDRVESLLQDTEPWYPLRYHIKTREGKRRKDKEVVFQRQEGKALYTDHLAGEDKEFEVPEAVFDPLSAFYRVRELDLKVGESTFVTVFDSKKVYDLEVKAIKEETVEVPAGVFETILVNPIMQSEGIFAREGPIFIWLSNDEKRIPVKMKSKAPVGSIMAELTGGHW